MSRNLEFDLTVVTPVLNGASTIQRTIDSVMSQRGLKVQYLIMDGESTDETVEIVSKNIGRSPEVEMKLIVKKDANMYEAINNGFKIAEGEFICYLNADDFFLPDSLYNAIQKFKARTDISVLYHDSLTEKNGWIFKNVPQPKYFIKLRIRLGHILFQESVLIRKSAFDLIREVPTEFRLAGDFALWLRLIKKVKIAKSGDEIGVFSIREGQLSEAYHEYRKEMMDAVFKRKFWRRTRIPKLWEKLAKWIQHYRFRWAINADENYYFGDYSNAFVRLPLNLKYLEKPKGELFENQNYNFLYSCIDNRFGNLEPNYWFIDRENEVASATPNKSLEDLRMLYEKHYSKKGDLESHSESVSPYKFFGANSRLRRTLYKLPIEIFAQRINPHIWGDNSLEILIRHTPRKLMQKPANEIDFLEIGAFEGDFLLKVKNRFGWNLHGVEMNSVAAEITRSKGMKVVSASAEDVDLEVFGKKFDIIYLGQVFEHFESPVKILSKLEQALKPDGIILITTPNLNSFQRKMFGPTWAHWHAPYHRNIFSVSSINKIALIAKLKIFSKSSHSHGYWTGLSVALNNRGVGGHVSHFSGLDPLTASRAQRIALFSNLILDRFLKGDYLAVSLRKSSRNHQI